MGPLLFAALLMSSNFSVIILMRQEGIKALSSWKTGVICVAVVPMTVFAIVAYPIILLLHNN